MYPVINKRETGVNLRRIMDQRELSVRDIQQFLALESVQSIYHWLNGLSLPTVGNLYALSELFQLPMDDLICGNRITVREKGRITDMDKDIRRLYTYYILYKQKRGNAFSERETGV